MRLHLDFETASSVSLADQGAYRYVEHPSTFIRCVGYAIDDGPVNVLRWPSALPPDLHEALRFAEIHAWNAQFERLVFERLWPTHLPTPTFNQFRCTAAKARVSALPGALDTCARLLFGQHKTRSSPAWFLPGPLTEDAWRLLHEYNMRDVLLERQIDELLPDMSDNDVFAYQLNERINDRGVLVDTELCQRMIVLLTAENERFGAQLTKLTDGTVTSHTQHARLSKWLAQQGVFVASVDKAHVRELLSGVLPPDVRRVLEIRQEAARSSLAKYRALLDRVSDDGRLRGAFVFSGAGQTGRFSSHGVQMHNLIRASCADAETAITDVKQKDNKWLHAMRGSVVDLAARLIRPTFMPAPGKAFIIGDYSAIEARALPWLAGEESEVLAWASGIDRYVDDARSIFDCSPEEVDDARRQIGKVVRLACGFGGRKGALLAMADSYNLSLTEAEAQRFADAWHAANPWVTRYGRELESCAVRAFYDPTKVFPARQGVAYASETVGTHRVLRCRLPSGRIISYHDVEGGHDSEGRPQLSSVRARTGVRERLWFGTLMENVTQAFCNDILRHALALIHGEGLPVVLHVHDELVVETAPGSAERVKELMETRPQWAATLPLIAKVTEAFRYTK
jgi:DNA polymerase